MSVKMQTPVCLLRKCIRVSWVYWSHFARLMDRDIFQNKPACTVAINGRDPCIHKLAYQLYQSVVGQTHNSVLVINIIFSPALHLPPSPPKKKQTNKQKKNIRYHDAVTLNFVQCHQKVNHWSIPVSHIWVHTIRRLFGCCDHDILYNRWRVENDQQRATSSWNRNYTEPSDPGDTVYFKLWHFVHDCQIFIAMWIKAFSWVHCLFCHSISCL